MKIFFVILQLAPGGAERVAFSLAKGLSETFELDARVIALQGFKKNVYEIEQINYIELKGNKLFNLRKLVVEHKPEIVVTMGVPICIYTIPALVGLKVKHIVSERNSPAHFAGKWRTKMISRWLMRFADGYVFQTEQARNFYGGRITKRSVVIHNPVCDINENQRDTSRLRKEIVAVGRLIKQKNHALLIESFAEISKQYSEYQLVIYGEGCERENLESFATKLGISDKVMFPGAISNVHERIKDAAMFVMSSDFEGMPNALMEAMALGLPCISTNSPCGGPADLIVDGVNGVLVSVGDKSGLVLAMKNLLEDSAYAESLGRHAVSLRDSHSLGKICELC